MYTYSFQPPVISIPVKDSFVATKELVKDAYNQMVADMLEEYILEKYHTQQLRQKISTDANMPVLLDQMFAARGRKSGS